MNYRDTTCPYCGVGCGVTAQVNGAQVIAVSGDSKHPANAGRLCVKGTALAETLGSGSRLLHPRLSGKKISWDASLSLVAEKLRQTRELHGPDSIGFYLSGQLLTEDYYVANKLMKGFLGSANVDTNSRLCMSSAVAGYKRAFGEDIVPVSYEDLEHCDLLVMVGSNAAWTHPVIYQRIVAAKKAKPDKRVVVIDTRSTATCDVADLHLQLNPGSDAFLFGGLLNHLALEGFTDHDYIEHHTSGFEASLAASKQLDVTQVCAATGLDSQSLARFYDWFAQTKRTVTLYSQGVNQSASGTDQCNAIINCHLATGRLGQPGMGPFSITGQPNAMGGREVGGLANQLAAHMDFATEDVDRVRRFWNAKDMAHSPGLKAVDLFQAAAEGKIRFLWIMATNPAVSLPDSDTVRKALQRCDFVVVSDCTADTDTAALADLLLPAQGWGEKDGTVTNSERVISRQRQLVPPLGEARPDWWIITQVAHRLGLKSAFDFQQPADIFREHAALSGFENNGTRAFDIGGLQFLDNEGFEAMAPVRWPVTAGVRTEPLTDGRCFTPDKRARFIAVKPTLPQAAGLVLNTGRLRDQWHTMTRTGLVPRLAQHRDFFTLSLNPAEARSRGLQDGDLVRVSNKGGQVVGLLSFDDGLPRGQCFAPIHWSHQYTARGTVSELIAAITDPVSGQPQSKFANVTLQPVAVSCWGYIFSRHPLDLEGIDYWSRIPVKGGHVTLIAATAQPSAVALRLQDSVQLSHGGRASYVDAQSGNIREICYSEGHIDQALFLAPDRNQLPQQQWISSLGKVDPGTPHALLSGLDPGGEQIGRLVCSCLEVGESQIARSIAAGADNLEALGQALQCGTQCGSCIPELKTLLNKHFSSRAA